MSQLNLPNWSHYAIPQITPEYMREWERRLESHVLKYAVWLAIENGWGSGEAPIWVWAEFFLMAERKYSTGVVSGGGRDDTDSLSGGSAVRQVRGVKG